MKTFAGLQRNWYLNSCLAGLLFILALLSSSVSIAQLSTASISGVVRDPSGAVVSNATVVLLAVTTSVENTSVSNGAGAYTFLNITPGRYTLKASATGFNSAEVPEFTLTVSQVATVDFSLKVGTQNTVVTVQGAEPELQTSSANLGTVIATRQVNDLPLNGRNFTQLLSLTPGVAPVSVGQNASGNILGTPVAVGSSFVFPAINGQTNRSNFFLTDSLNNYGEYFSTYAVPPIIDAIQEFEIVSHADNAEFGSVLGGVVNVVTKSGTNDFHGSAWEYARNTVFDARSYFLPTTVAKTPYSQNQFGGSVGGPVRIPKLYNGKNKTFFFVAYQGFRYSQTSDTLLKVPTAQQLAGDESSWPTQIYNPLSTRPDPANPGRYIRDPFPGNQIPSTLIDPRMVALANALFPPAGRALDSAGDNVINTNPLTQTQNEWNVRVDQKIGENDSVFFRYSAINSVEGEPGGLPTINATISIPARNWGGSYVHVFSPSLNLQAQVARTTAQEFENVAWTPPIAPIISQVGFSSSFVGQYAAATSTGGNLLPGPGITGYASGNSEVLNVPKATSSIQYGGVLAKTLGDHLLKIGGGYISMGQAVTEGVLLVGFAGEQTADTNPMDTVNSGDPVASYLLNVPNNAERVSSDEAERPGGVMSLFVQDTWRTTNKLTLNVGLRYDLTFIPPIGTNGSVGQRAGLYSGDMDFSNGTYILPRLAPACSVSGVAPCIPGDGTLPTNVVVDPRGKIAHNVYTNLGPRFGFAYRVDDKTVVRGAFGIVYDNWAAQVEQAQEIASVWPNVGNFIVSNLNQPSTTSATPTIQAQAPFGSNPILLPPPTPFTQVGQFYDPHEKNPMSDQWNFGVERLLNESTTMTLNYVGSVGRRLIIGGYYNTALSPGPGDPQSRALYPYIAPTDYDHSVGSSNYNAFQFSLNKRYANGFAYQVAYTWSKSMDVGGDGWFGVEGAVPQDPYNPSAFGGYAVAGTDLTNYLSVNTLNQSPIGKGKSFSTKSGVLDYLLGNWQLNNIFSAHSGLPFTPVISSDIANTGNGGTYETLNVVGNPNLAHRTPAEWFNTAAYAVPPGFTYGTAGRDSLRSAGGWDLDSSLFRQFPVGEGRQFEFRAEAFNLLNHPVLGTPVSNLTSGSSFGTVDTTASVARQLQLALKFIF
jgi:hypothetical protein